MRVVGTDPGTSSLDVLVLDDGLVADQVRFQADSLKADPHCPLAWLESRGAFDLVAGPSGYGLPVKRAADCTPEDFALMSLVRPNDDASGVVGFSAVVRAFAKSSLPVVFLPGVIHLPSVPSYRKWNRIDMGTADKLCVAALALALRSSHRGIAPAEYSGCIVEVGSAFTACVVIQRGKIVDGVGGTSGPLGWRSGGAWDGELAYWLAPVEKADLFRGGITDAPAEAERNEAMCESLTKTVAGLASVHEFDEIVLSGRLLEKEPELGEMIEDGLGSVRPTSRLGSLDGATVKHAAQGAALLADSLAGGSYSEVLRSLEIGSATGTALDYIIHPRFAGEPGP